MNAYDTDVKRAGNDRNRDVAAGSNIDRPAQADAAIVSAAIPPAPSESARFDHLMPVR